MTYEDFISKVVQFLTKEYEGKASVQVEYISKMNGVGYEAIVVKKNDLNITPSINLPYFYKHLKSDDDFLAVANEMKEHFETMIPSKSCDISDYLEYERARDRISFRLVNYELNKELLEEVAHVRYLDLAIIFQYTMSIDVSVQHTGSIIVKNAHLDMWGITAEKLYEDVLEEIDEKFPFELIPINDYLQPSLPFELEELPLYLLSNFQHNYGATAILYPFLLESFSDSVEDDFYLIPSSVHEVLLLPKKVAFSAEVLNELVREVNMHEIEREEVLSDHVYYYSRKTKALSETCEIA